MFHANVLKLSFFGLYAVNKKVPLISEQIANWMRCLAKNSNLFVMRMATHLSIRVYIYYKTSISCYNGHCENDIIINFKSTYRKFILRKQKDFFLLSKRTILLVTELLLIHFITLFSLYLDFMCLNRYRPKIKSI